MRLLSIRSSPERGDTIVEVMIVLAVLGMAMSISYATANKSLLATRAAQESATANVLLQTQVELLRSMVGNNKIASTDTNFCIDPTGDSGHGSITPVASNPGPCHTTNTPVYNITITQSPAQTFTAVATWDDVSGQPPTDSATLVYKVYP